MAERHGIHEPTMTPDTERLRGLAALGGKLVDAGQFAGIGWRVLQHGTVVAEGLVGHADYGRKRPLDDDTLYRLYSMTKPVISVAALQLIEAGRLQLGDPVEAWVPAFADMQVLGEGGKIASAARPVTIEDLLTHRAGLSYDFMPDCAVADLYRDAALTADGTRSLEGLVGEIGRLPLTHQPGARFHYSYATDVLAHVLERVCDEPLQDLLERAMFRPLGMQDTGFEVAVGDQHRLADMYGMRELHEVPPAVDPEHELLPMTVEASYPSNANGQFARGGIGLFSTLSDYAGFAECLHSGRAASGEVLLSLPMIDLLWSNRLPRSQRPIATGRHGMGGYGWGLIGRVMVDLGESMHLSVAGEGGWAGAASTWFWCDRRNGITGLVFSQFLGSTVALGPLMQSAAYRGFSAAR